MAGLWSFLICDLRTNAIIGEVPFDSATPVKVLNDTGTLQCTWTLTAESTKDKDPYTWTTPCRTAIYALRDGVPWWGGIVWTRKYDSSGNPPQLTIGAADWWSYFDHRRVVPLLDTTHGESTLPSQVVAYTGTEQNDIARGLVALAQTHTGGNIGVQVDSTVSGFPRDRTYYGYQVPVLGDQLRDLAGDINGCDIMFDVEPVMPGNGRGPTRLMRVGTPHLGQFGSPHVWEHTKNVLAYSWPSDGTKMASREYAIGSGMDEGTPIAVVEDTTLYDDNWPLLEDDTSYPTVEDADTLIGHAASDQAANRLPVVIPELTVLGGSTPRVGEVSPGDDGRLIIPAGDLFIPGGIDCRVRVVSISVQATDPQEATTITTNPITEDVT